MAPRIAWVLNLDADLELAARRNYEPSRSVRAAMRPHVEWLASQLLAEGDVLVEDRPAASPASPASPLFPASPGASAHGLVGRAFCPTKRALALLVRAGAKPEPHPSMEVLRTVNARAFAAALGPTLPGAAFVRDLAVARTMLATNPGVGDAWRLKRLHGVAGRGQRVVVPAALGEGELAFLRAAVAEGGLQIEPNVRVEREYALHGVLGAEGSLRLGRLVRQRCDDRGAWLATEPIEEPSDVVDVAERLTAEATRVAGALSRAGYFGPFGIDAYTYRDRQGGLHLQPRSEINARYTMGFAVGFGRGGPASKRLL